MYRFGAALLFLAGLVSLLQNTGWIRYNAALPIQGVSGTAIPEEKRWRMVEKRDNSPTDWCFKWAQQSAVVNGTLYLYGGQLATEHGQTQNTWNNDFLGIDLLKSWQRTAPTFKGLPQPDGPPAVALGYLWSSMDSLYLYGGEFSWKPPVNPTPFSTWEYNIKDGKWIEHSKPITSDGKSAPSDDTPVQRAAEGAGVSVPNLGRGYYFGGHLDTYTTPDWDISIAREYLQSLLEFTFPGYSNSQVDTLNNGKTAGDDGVYRNVTESSLQKNYGFTKRADGLLIYVPGFGDQGILVALAGGTNESFTQMNQVNVYDIATSSWYLQATTGAYPDPRVNPCAVIAAAPDGSSYNIYMFGGQRLLPYGNQKQFDDMWILTLPAYTWIRVDQSTQAVPPGRSGATCNIWDAQMVMVGGYIGEQLTCEWPATYIFDLSKLVWENEFKALSSSDAAISSNPFNQQANQKSSGSDTGGLEGSYGYRVPEVVYNVVGGDQWGGATITKPVAMPTAGPMKTGSPITYTVTKPNGAIVTEQVGGNAVTSSGGHGTNVAAIVVGVVCGVLFVIICYLLFCLFVYRKQLKLYKHHVEMSQRQARGEKPADIAGLWTTNSNGKDSSSRGEGNQLLTPAEVGSTAGSQRPSQGGSGHQTGSSAANGYSSQEQSARRSSIGSSTEDLLAGHEPTFVGVMLNPRRSLKVINRD